MRRCAAEAEAGDGCSKCLHKLLVRVEDIQDGDMAFASMLLRKQAAGGLSTCYERSKICVSPLESGSLRIFDALLTRLPLNAMLGHDIP